ncbi:MAG: hypothetical protein B9S32_06160 [Verrucomicrobia bacterium Tous-C9LFEB]|nr:MAG: hypothetical protein B9S32_06160 [Verrucomicrobia bacterium Tous-C9LFEB]
MKIIAIIPARGGSKRIRGKNVMSIGGAPLVAHSIRHCLAARQVDETYVTSDDEAILKLTAEMGATPVARPLELAGDTCTSESALIHVLDWRREQGLPDPDYLVFLQATSPVRRLDDIDRAIDTLRKQGADSLFSATINKALIWASNDGQLTPINYNFHQRRREQDMAIQYRENGSIYVLRPSVLRENNNRLGGKMTVYEMDTLSSFQIDEPIDVEICDFILRRPEFRFPPRWPQKIGLLAFDFDGVMTDNAAWVDQEGVESVRCWRSDGLGISRLRKLGVPMLILSTEANKVVAARAAKLKIECIQDVPDKAKALREICQSRNIPLEEVIFVGNDTNDLPALSIAGLPVAVGDSHPDVLRIASLILRERGGHGAVRELCDLLADHLEKQRPS